MEKEQLLEHCQNVILKGVSIFRRGIVAVFKHPQCGQLSSSDVVKLLLTNQGLGNGLLKGNILLDSLLSFPCIIDHVISCISVERMARRLRESDV